MKVEAIDNSQEFINAMQDAALRALEKCGLFGERQAKTNITNNKLVDTGNLRNSISHQVDPSEPAVYIGTNVEYAIYPELGTGKYYPGGRPTPWVYQDEKGNWHLTYGQRAQPYLKPAVADHVGQYESIIKGELKSG